MDFISNSQLQIDEMLAKIGISQIGELFQSIPNDLLLQSPINDDGLSEWEGKKFIENIAKKNTFLKYHSYLGGGAYEHHIPAIVSSICSRGEFLTSYTPYQAEASQGMLQAIFEFQSAICALTKMDVANASVYDGASACAEACLMALRIQGGKKRLLVADSLHPNYRKVVEQYISSHHATVELIPFDPGGKVNQERLKQLMNEEVAAILIQSPNFLGIVEETEEISSLAKKYQSLVIICANPLAYGLYNPPGVLGADIAVGDCQPFGIPLQFGGPYVGYMACKKEYVRQLPGRIVGQTLDQHDRKGFVLTLQAREQHIRREKATSNICTNQALCALSALIAILWYGKQGIHNLALTNFQRASYLQHHLGKIPHIQLWGAAPIFNEFVVQFTLPIDRVLTAFRKEGIEPGLSLEKFFPKLKNRLLVNVTETKSIDDLNQYVEVARTL
ncbi:MAG: aminomethyl-transferring glycine dehydrogenase subunit GcvPA [Parachlamydiaceae bacterium]